MSSTCKGCLLCHTPLEGHVLMTLDHMPASAQDIPNESQLAQDAGISLQLCQCPSCGLTQFSCEPVSYYRDVIRSGGFSTTMVELRQRQYTHLLETYQLRKKDYRNWLWAAVNFCGYCENFQYLLTGLNTKRN